jgi:hypothetical protein
MKQSLSLPNPSLHQKSHSRRQRLRFSRELKRYGCFSAVGNRHKASQALTAWQAASRRPIRQLVGPHAHLDEAREIGLNVCSRAF